MCDNCYDKVIGRIREELSDIETYREMASSTEDVYLRLILENIVQDEESHARYLAKTLKVSGRAMPEELWKQYYDMESSFPKRIEVSEHR